MTAYHLPFFSVNRPVVLFIASPFFAVVRTVICLDNTIPHNPFKVQRLFGIISNYFSAPKTAWFCYVTSFVREKALISSALSGFCAQPSRSTTLFCAIKSTYGVVDFSDKRGSKSPKKPQNCSFLLGVAVQSDLRGGSMSPRLFLQQNTAKPEFYHLSPNCRILRSLAWLAYLVVLLLKLPHRTFFWLTRGYLRQKRRRS